MLHYKSVYNYLVESTIPLKEPSSPVIWGYPYMLHQKAKLYRSDFYLVPEIVKKIVEVSKDNGLDPSMHDLKSVKTQLLDHQNEGVRWMLQREQDLLEKYLLWNGESLITSNRVSQPRSIAGGILGDDMGLGKTLQIISLIYQDYDVVSQSNLIICPKALIQHWKSEFDKHAGINAKTLVHGQKRKRSGNNGDFMIRDGQVYITNYEAIANLPNVKNYEWHRIILVS
jgi:SNF2 family DNA or RNA helicase